MRAVVTAAYGSPVVVRELPDPTPGPGELLVPGGRLASTLGLGPDQFAGRDLTAVAVMAQPTEESLERLASLVAQGALRVPITRTYSLKDAPRAFREFPGLLGKAAVDVATH